MDIESQLREGSDRLGLDLTNAQVASLLKYLGLLEKWGRIYNLTALRDPRQMLTHHILDCLAVVGPLRRHTAGKPARLLDVGSGAGLPGAIIALVCPEVCVDSVDAAAKKSAFVRQVAATLSLPNLHGIHGRAENLSGPYDVVCSRAFASLADFTMLTRGALAAAGVWMAMKGKTPADEIAQLPSGVSVFHVEQLQVPGLGAERCLVWLRIAPALT